LPRTRTLLALVLLPLLIFLVACGGDDDDGGSSTSSDQPSASDSSAPSASDDQADDDADDADDSADSDSDGDSDGDADAATVLANCPELVSMFGAFSAGAFVNPGAGGNLTDDLETVAQVFQNAADNAPSEIKADMQVLANAFTGFYTALDDLGVDFSNPATFATLSAEEQAEFQSAIEALDTPELQQASDNLDAWFSENCE
jgi:hypothetical protein